VCTDGVGISKGSLFATVVCGKLGSFLGKIVMANPTDMNGCEEKF